MKFGLLVVLAVAVLVPSLSEGRTVSKCELKEKLGQAITLPPQLQQFKKQYLAIVICEVNRWSRLNTNLVKVFGKRTTTTTATPTTTVTTLAPQVNGTTTAPTTTVTTLVPQVNGTTTAPTTIQLPTTTRPIPTGATNSTLGTNETKAVINRRKRDVISVESDSAEMDSSEKPSGKKSSLSLGLYEIFKMSEETDGEESNKESSKESSEESSKERSEESSKESSKSDEDEDSDDKDEDEDEDSDEKDEDEAEEGGKRKKRSTKDQSSEESEESEESSLGLYGLFQLSDATFCNSGYRSSNNKCNTTCDAFTDDNIVDDIACFVKTDRWRLLLKSASRLCRIGTKNYFDKCK